MFARPYYRGKTPKSTSNFVKPMCRQAISTSSPPSYLWPLLLQKEKDQIAKVRNLPILLPNGFPHPRLDMHHVKPATANPAIVPSSVLGISSNTLDINSDVCLGWPSKSPAQSSGLMIMMMMMMIMIRHFSAERSKLQARS